MSKLSKAKKGIVIACVIFVLALVLTVVMVSRIPHSVKIESQSGNIIDVLTFDSGEWLYATSSGALVYKDAEHQDLGQQNVVTVLSQKYGFAEGQLRKIYKANGDQNIWGIVSSISKNGETPKAYLFKASWNAGTLEILASQEFKGNVDNSYFLLAGDRFFIACTGQQVAQLYSFNAEDLTFEEDDTTVLYGCNKTRKGEVKLNAIKMANGISMFIAKGDYLYIMYDGGLIRMAKDFSDVRYESKGMNYTVDSLDTAKYMAFQFTGIVPSGGAYVEKTNTFYIFDQSNLVHKFTMDKIDTVEIGKTLDCDVVSTIQLAEIPKISAAVEMDPATNMGCVMYSKIDGITLLDLENEQVDFDFKLAFNIDKIIYGTQSGDVFYIYKNVNETGKNDQNILAFANMHAMRTEGLFSKLALISAVVCVAAAITALVLMIIVLRRKEEAAVKTLKQIRRSKWVYIAMIPSVILLICFCYYEAIASIALSFFDYTAEKPTMLWNNFANYKEVFTSIYAAEAFSNMVIFLVFDLIVAVIPPLLFAFFLTILRWEKLSNFVRTALFVSGVIPSVAGMLVWRFGIYGGDGVLNTIIEAFGGQPVDWLGSTDYAKWSVLMIGFPFVGAYLIFYGGMMNIPKSYYEAAELEGIGIWKRFFIIDLPLIVPQLKYVIITSFIHSMQNYARTYMVTNGGFGTYTPVHLMYKYMQEDSNYGLASAYATIIFVLLFFATFINMRTQKKGLED